MRTWLVRNLNCKKLGPNHIPWSLLFEYVMWFIWIARNNWVIAETVSSKDRMQVCTKFAKGFLQAQLCAQHSYTGYSSNSRQNNAWVKPTCSSVKLNVDTAVASNQRKAAVGYIARDSAGIVLGAFAKKVGFCSPLFGELWAIFHCLDWAKRMKYRNIIVEIDCELACRIVNNPESWRGISKL